MAEPDIMMASSNEHGPVHPSEDTRLDEISLGSTAHEATHETVHDVRGAGHGDSGHEHGPEHEHGHEDGSREHGVEASGGHEVHEHNECQLAVPVDRVASILMVTRTDASSLRDLSSLAQRICARQASPSP